MQCSNIGGDYDVVFTPLSSEELRKLVHILVGLTSAETIDANAVKHSFVAKSLGIELSCLVERTRIAEKDFSRNVF